MKILAIESTCDETGAAVVAAESVDSGVEVLSNVVASSSEMHEKYGGIVPEVAAREQVKVITSVVEEAMKVTNRQEIEAIAVSVGPGLIGSLLIGVETAKSLALAWEKPLIPVNHLRGHLMANLILGQTAGVNLSPTLPFAGEGAKTRGIAQLPAIGLLVSGGHTELVRMKSISDWEWIGGTRDDAAGECFDKCARLLDLGYPGGPAIEKAAMAFHLGGAPSGHHPRSKATIPSPAKERDRERFKLPRPMIHGDSLEMSFSGLKAAVAKVVNSEQLTVNGRDWLARELNEAIVEVLVNKTMKAVDKYGYENVWLAGGVAANKLLRQELDNRCKESGIRLWVPEFKYCTDNAAMIGAEGIIQLVSHLEGVPAAGRATIPGGTLPMSNAEDILSVKAEPGMGI